MSRPGSDLVPLVVAGPTASGKSAWALRRCEALRTGGVEAEIICADSRQLYEGMQIGAAGPSPEERARAPHHGFGEIPPEETYDAGRFLEDTDARLAAIQARGHKPILVGGTGLYLRAWRHGLDDVPGADPAVRARLQAALDEEGAEALHRKLAEVDPEGAARIAPGDPVRILRSLEVFEVTGRPASELRRSHLRSPPRVEAEWLLLDAELAWLTPRIEARARAMLAGGLVEEAVALRERLGQGHRLLGTMGYEEALALVDDELDLEEAVRRTAVRTRRYAKRQRTWFKKEPWWTRLDPAGGEGGAGSIPESE